MSQKVTTRKGALNEEKEKRQSPSMDVKKKTASTAEKDKQPIEKTDKQEKVSDKSEKQIDKSENQNDKTEKQSEKPEKPDKKQTEKSEKPDKKQSEKSEKQPDKGTEKNGDKKDKTTEKKDVHGEKSKEDADKDDKNVKNEPQENQERPQQNGTAKVVNGVGTNGTAEELNGTVSGGESDEDDVTLVIDDEPDHDEMFPELKYDDSDTEFELPIGDGAPSRSLTRRSQVKPTRTPETPRPASDKQTDKERDADPKESKLAKLKDQETPTSDRKLRSADSPKAQEGKKGQDKKQDKTLETVAESEKEEANTEVEKELEVAKEINDQVEKEPVVKVIDIVLEEKNEKSKEKTQGETVEMEVEDEKEEPRKLDTNYSKSRVKVSPYRRSGRLADQTSTSIMANYTGNNTTMEMDITETSMMSERESSPPEEGSYIKGLRSIRGRSSYKKLGQLSLSNLSVNKSVRSQANTSVSATDTRPTAPVVGRKRRPDSDRDVLTYRQPDSHPAVGCKRMRLLDRIAQPFRRNVPHTLQVTSPEIVGINTDLPLTAPVVSSETFDPETLKPPASTPQVTPTEPIVTPLTPHQQHDNKRCSIM